MPGRACSRLPGCGRVNPQLEVKVEIKAATLRFSEAAETELARLGFRRRAQGVLALDAAEDVLGWLGLNRATRHGVLEVNPVVGVRHQRVERLVAELTGVRFHPWSPPTLSSHLGYLMPQQAYLPWVVRAVEDAPGKAAELAAAVAEHGLPFVRANASLAALAASMAGGMGMPEQVGYRLPVAWHLLGDDARAEQALASGLARLGQGDHPAAREFRAFAEALRRRRDRA
jgi:hypothetical protein